MSYLYTDFVTRLPIQPGQKVILFFINETLYKQMFHQKNTQNPNEGFSAINKKAIPVSYPFIAHYGDHGDFVLDTAHTVENQAAWTLLHLNYDSNLKDTVDLTMPLTFDHNKINDLMKNAGISVTTYNTFIKASDKLKNTLARQGIFSSNNTVSGEYYARKHTLKTYFNTVEDKRQAVGLTMDMDQMTPIQPDIINRKAFSLMLTNEKHQKWIAAHADKTIDTHIIRWEAFTSYLEIARIPFGPVAGIGSQTDENGTFVSTNTKSDPTLKGCGHHTA